MLGYVSIHELIGLYALFGLIAYFFYFLCPELLRLACLGGALPAVFLLAGQK
jgi:hypothetical protein